MKNRIVPMGIVGTAGRVTAWLGVVVLVAACSDSVEPLPPPEPVIPAFGEVTTTTNGQVGTVGQALPDSVTLIFRDSLGRPVADVEVTWDVATGNGQISPASGVSRADGTVRSAWVLDTIKRKNEALASIDGFGAIRVVAYADAGPPTQVIASAPQEDLPVGVGRGITLAASAADRYGNLIDGAPSWEGLDPSIGYVSENGDFIGVAIGTARVVATVGALADTVAIPVAAESPGSRWIDYALSEFYTCAVDESGAVWCWGDNQFGQYGNGTIVDEAVPQRVGLPAGLRFRSVAVTTDGACALTEDGIPWCWGRLIHESTRDIRAMPTLIPKEVDTGGIRFASLAIGTGGNLWADGRACGLTADGNAYCWGGNQFGQLGNGTIEDSYAELAQVVMPAGRRFTQIATAIWTTCALADDGTIWCWGLNYHNQNVLTYRTLVPTQVATPGGAVATSIAGHSTSWCYSTTSGEIHCWGSGPQSQLSGPRVSGWLAEPRVVPTPPGVTFARAAATSFTSCGLTSDGDGWCWGSGGAGQHGSGVAKDTAQAPVKVLKPGPVTFASMRGGRDHLCALTTAGDLYCWGYGVWGELGSGYFESSPVPRRVVKPGTPPFARRVKPDEPIVTARRGRAAP